MNSEKIFAPCHVERFDEVSEAATRSTLIVVAVTLIMMVVEISVGLWSNSMALLADGLHMSSHAVAIGVSALAYVLAHRLAGDPRFAFGTFKIEVLGGFASAIFLLGVAVMMVVGSFERLLAPQAIHYPQAIAVAVLGLLVNAVCAWILGAAHHGHAHAHGHGHAHGHDHGYGHAHSHGHAHDHGHDHRPTHAGDLNLRSAYLHVIADALTSVLAIVALCAGLFLGWDWLDPLMGVIGAGLVVSWGIGLIKVTGRILLDREMDHPLVREIPARISIGPSTGIGPDAMHGRDDPSAAKHMPDASIEITDLHVWRVGKQAFACAMSVRTTDRTLDADTVRRRLAGLKALRHVTVELHYEANA